jgi:hypothetical protein
MKRWFAFLLFAAAAAVAFGLWEVRNGRGSFGWGLIAIAVADVVFISGLYAYKALR